MTNFIILEFIGGTLIATCIAATTSSIKSGLLAHAKLSSKDNSTNISIDALPECVYETDDSKERSVILRSGIWNHSIEFERALDIRPNISLGAYYQNFPKVKLYINSIDDRSKYPEKFYYDGQDNAMKLDPLDIRASMLKSTLLLSSTYETENILATGFTRTKKNYTGSSLNYKIGESLTSGYTTLLYNRYFGTGDKPSSPIEMAFAKLIELIIGKDEMESMYFRGALNELVGTLCKYASYDEVIIMLRKMDHMYGAIHETKNVIAKVAAKPTYREVVNLLSNMLVTKARLEDMRKPRLLFEDMNGIIELSNASHKDGIVLYDTRQKCREKMLNDFIDGTASKGSSKSM